MKRLLILIAVLFITVTVSCTKDDVEICADSELKLNCGNIIYPKESNSPYVLPWKIGKTYSLGQGNCSDGSHSEGSYNQFAYDFGMKIGDEIVAVQSGVVMSLVESNIDNVEPGKDSSKNNFIVIKHKDGTEALYLHLTLNGALKEVGDNVEQGEVIALSGNTGWSSGPHLHLQIDGPDGGIPTTFKNTKPHCQGLIDYKFNPEGYTAEKY